MGTGDAELWEPLGLTEVIALFADADFQWWISGGLALELHVGRSWRDHDDVDVGVRRADAQALHRRLRDWDLWLAAGGQLTPWHGAALDPARPHNNIWIRREPGGPWNIDVTIGEGNDIAWSYRRDPTISRSWCDAVLTTGDGVPYLAPDLQLLFKSKTIRDKDQLDAEQVIPKLAANDRAFLAAALSDDHRWQALLTRAG